MSLACENGGHAQPRRPERTVRAVVRASGMPLALNAPDLGCQRARPEQRDQLRDVKHEHHGVSQGRDGPQSGWMGHPRIVRRVLHNDQVARFEAGYWNGDLRFGYSKVEAGQETKNGVIKKLYKPMPNSDARHVLTAYEMCAIGYLDQQITDALNHAGARTYRLLENAKRKAGPDTDPKLRRPWVKDSVAALFNREAAQFYLGNMVYVGEKERKKVERQQQIQIRQGTHEAIITQDLCDRG